MIRNIAFITRALFRGREVNFLLPKDALHFFQGDTNVLYWCFKENIGNKGAWIFRISEAEDESAILTFYIIIEVIRNHHKSGFPIKILADGKCVQAAHRVKTQNVYSLFAGPGSLRLSIEDDTSILIYRLSGIIDRYNFISRSEVRK